jgi:hypothetical protein
MKFTRLFFFTVGLILTGTIGMATDSIPECMASGKAIGINDEQVINWKNTTANKFHSRAHIKGKLVINYPDRNGHNHMEVLIGPNNQDTIEVIYNKGFGELTGLNPGAIIEACGDYITSSDISGSYPASPDGAILHWVHLATNKSHDSGYVIVDGVVCGNRVGSKSPKSPKSPKHGKQ